MQDIEEKRRKRIVSIGSYGSSLAGLGTYLLARYVLINEELPTEKVLMYFALGFVGFLAIMYVLFKK